MTSVYDFSARDIDGNERSLGEWRGKTLLIVNVASKCGFTPQYKGLETCGATSATAVWWCWVFPATSSVIRSRATRPRSELLQHPVRRQLSRCSPRSRSTASTPIRCTSWLKSEGKGILGSEAIKWNFTKFLVDAEGQVVKRYASTDTPEKIGKDIAGALCAELSRAQRLAAIVGQQHGDRIHVAAGCAARRRGDHSC